jgi:hypothetical protein
MTSLSDIRARLSAAENRGQNNPQQGDNSLYPFWNIDEGKSATVRFLPDGNPDNTFFWQERSLIRLEFPGIKGGEERKSVTVRVPCVEMWNDTCPILTEVRTWFKDESLKEMGRKYWKKRDYLFQGFVRENPLAEENSPENPLRRFIIGPQIFNIVKSALMDPELEELPTDYQRGLDFRITKSSKGGFADYSTSTWARRESPLTSQETAAIAQYGLHDLASFLPKKPTETELKVIAEMFEASVDGQLYDSDRWGNYFRPTGMSAPTSAPSASPQPREPEPVAKPVAESKPAPTPKQPEPETEAQSGSASKAEDILRLIRERQSQA